MARNISSRFGVAEGLVFENDVIVQNISIDNLVPYHNHRFALYSGERLDDMVESVRQNGIINPIIVRTTDDREKYEILSGHNRVNAARLAGIEEVPVIIKSNLSDEDAESYVIITNLNQRGFADLRISEQAFAVAARYEKMFDERKLAQIRAEMGILDKGESHETDNKNVSVREATAQEYGIGSTTVARLLRINKLSNEFKALVDNKNLGIRQGVNISYLTDDQQTELYEMMTERQITAISLKQSAQLKEIVTSYQFPDTSLFEQVLDGRYDNDSDESEDNTGQTDTNKSEPKPTKADVPVGHETTETLEDKSDSDYDPADKTKKVEIAAEIYYKYLRQYNKDELRDVVERAVVAYCNR